MTTMSTDQRVSRHNSTTPPLPESKPLGRHSTDEVFLTPRIIDAAAYSEYSESLKALLTQLDDRAATLSATSADTDKLCAVLRQAAQQLKSRIDTAAKTQTDLERRSASAQKAIAAINQAIGNEAETDALIESIVARHQRTIEHRLTQSFARLERDLEAKLTNAEDRATRAEQRADAAEQRFTQLSERLLALATQADTVDEHISETLAAAERNADRSATNALEAIEQLRLIANEAKTTAAGNTAEVEKVLGPVRTMLADASSLVGTADKPGSLKRAIDDADALAQRLDATNAETERQLASSTQAHTAIVDTITAAAESLETLSTRRNELRATIEDDLEAIAAEVSPLERAAATIRRALDELADRAQSIYNNIAEADRAASQTAQAVSRAIENSDPTAQAQQRIAALQEAAQAITDQTLKQVEEAAEWLAALAAQAHPPQPINHG